MDVSTILVVIAVVLFALSAFGDRFNSPVNLIAAGLFFWALSTLL